MSCFGLLTIAENVWVLDMHHSKGHLGQTSMLYLDFPKLFLSYGHTVVCIPVFMSIEKQTQSKDLKYSEPIQSLLGQRLVADTQIDPGISNS